MEDAIRRSYACIALAPLREATAVSADQRRTKVRELELRLVR